MNLEWKSFLESDTATVDDEGVVHFANAEPFPECGLHDLSHLGLLRVSGEDAADFLQGQLTNDIKTLGENRSQMAGYCTPQGRMLANFRVFRRDGAFFLQLPLELLEPIQKRLTLFVLMSQVTLEDVTAQLVRIGLSGTCAPRLLEKLVPDLPVDAGDVVQAESVSLLRLPGPTERFQIMGPLATMQELWSELREQASPASADYWGLLDIQAGIPTIYQATSESFVPQMTNMQLVDGVSFDKGCYVGQEVVARMKYLGKLKRHMRLARVTVDRKPQAGEEIYAAESAASGQGAGTLVDARPAPAGGFEVLVVVEDASFEQNNLHLESPTGAPLEFLQLPYSLDDDG
jgi:folate-binding protein YgfZ